MFYIKYLTMHKVHMHVGAIRQLLYSCMVVCMYGKVYRLINEFPPQNGTFEYSYNLHKENQTLPQHRALVNWDNILVNIFILAFFLSK